MIKLNPDPKNKNSFKKLHISNTKQKVKTAWNRVGKQYGKILQKSVLTDYKYGKKSGRIYIINGKPHRSSASGETPALLTGAYGKAIGYNITGKKLNFGIKASLPYGIRLEEGLNRTGLKNAVDKNKNKLKITLARKVIQSL